MSKSIDLRETAVVYYENGHMYEETGKVFQVGKSTVYTWVKKKRETDDLQNKPRETESLHDRPSWWYTATNCKSVQML